MKHIICFTCTNASACPYLLSISVAFSSGNSKRERNLLDSLKKLEPGIFVLPIIKSLDLYLAVLNEAKLFISGDTAPLHFSHALGVKVIGLFGIHGSKKYAAPLYSPNEKVIFDVQNYNFDDQSATVLKNPIKVSSGDRIKVECTFDPTRRQRIAELAKLAPRYVTWGEGSSDEMCLGVISAAKS